MPRSLLALFVMLMLAACSDDAATPTDGGVADLAPAWESGASRPCPVTGLGVADIPGGHTAAEQVANWRDYQCGLPQVCPDQAAVTAVGFVVAPATPPRSLVVNVTNCSMGSSSLTIEKVVVVGDAQCHMTEAEVESSTIDPGMGRFVRVQWKPKAEGRDDAAILIYTNAPNSPLKVPVCGATDSSAAPLKCQDVTTVNTTCHSEKK